MKERRYFRQIRAFRHGLVKGRIRRFNHGVTSRTWFLLKYR